MTSEDEKYYETYFDLFMHPGWKQFISELTDTHSSYRIEDIQDERALNLVKGERAILFRMMHFAESIKNAYDLIEEREHNDA